MMTSRTLGGVRRVLGDYLHLTRQHWISSLSLILPGNDDDSHLPTAIISTALSLFGGNLLPFWALWISSNA